MKQKIVSEKIQDYIRRGCSTVLGIDEEPQVAIPATGRNSEVYLLTYPSGLRVVLRAFTERREYDRYRLCLQHVAGKSLPIPGLLGIDDSLRTRMTFRRSFLLEEFAHGPLLEEIGISVETAGMVLCSLGQLHDLTSPKWGLLDNLRREEYAPYLLVRLDNVMADMEDHAPFFRADERKEWFDWCRRVWERLPHGVPFSTVHQHLAPDDIVIAQDRTRAIFLDNGGIQVGHFAHDLEDVLAFLEGTAGPSREEAIRIYTSHRATLPVAFDYAPLEPFFRADYHLKKLRSSLKRYRRDGEARRPAIEKHLAALRRLTGGAR